MPSDSIVFVDTNVFLYSFDPRDSDKRARAQQWLAWCWLHRSGRVSTQVMNELYANALRKFSHVLPKDMARDEIRRLRAWQPWPLDDDTVEGAWSLQDGHALNYWDALLVSAAQRLGCHLFLSEDLQHGQSIGGVRILNPFLVEPESLDATP